jgi:hypothetical protein
MTRRRTIIAACTALPLALHRPVGAQAADTLDLAGAKYPPTQSLAGATLVLNGAGIRYRFVVKVYAAGLYLQAKAGTPEAVYAATGPKRMLLSMLRDIDANELGKLFTRAMQDNLTREEFARLIPGTVRLAEMFQAKKRLAPGEWFSIDWVPGKGSTVVVNGKPQGEPIAEPEFFNGLMRIWLGKSPADQALKEALLGMPARPAPGTQ